VKLGAGNGVNTVPGWDGVSALAQAAHSITIRNAVIRIVKKKRIHTRLYVGLCEL
jgi:hypothetical protein